MIEYIGKCLLIEEKKSKILCAGDLHLGYENALNESGVLISRHMFNDIIEYFDRIFEKTGKVDKIVLLGDVKHHFAGILGQEWTEVLKLFDYLLKNCKEIIIAKGNHDNILEPIARNKEKITISDYFSSGKYIFMHGQKDFAEIWDKKFEYLIIGHYHPAVRISDGVKSEMYKCFLSGKQKGKNIIILPSFFPLIEGVDLRETAAENVFNIDFENMDAKVVSDDLKVLDFGKLKNLGLS